MDPGFMSAFFGKGGGLPGFSSSSSAAAIGGTQATPWNQGDIVVSYGSGDARSGDRTAPAPVAANGATGAAGGLAGGIGVIPLAIAGVVIVGAVIWRMSR